MPRSKGVIEHSLTDKASRAGHGDDHSSTK
jgi:hypothetical protein